MNCLVHGIQCPLKKNVIDKIKLDFPNLYCVINGINYKLSIINYNINIKLFEIRNK